MQTSFQRPFTQILAFHLKTAVPPDGARIPLRMSEPLRAYGVLAEAAGPNQPPLQDDTMTGMTKSQSDAESWSRARRDLRRAEAGDAASVSRLHQKDPANPAGTEAAEQQASDGTGKRGLSR